jgi:hypothetical protein
MSRDIFLGRNVVDDHHVKGLRLNALKRVVIEVAVEKKQPVLHVGQHDGSILRGVCAENRAQHGKYDQCRDTQARGLCLEV